MITAKIFLSSINVENEELINYIIEQKDQKISLMQGDISNLVTVFGVMIAIMAIIATVVIVYIGSTNNRVQRSAKEVSEQLKNLKDEEVLIKDKNKKMDSMIKDLEDKIGLINNELKTDKVIQSLNYVNKTNDAINRNRKENKLIDSINILKNIISECNSYVVIADDKNVILDEAIYRRMKDVKSELKKFEKTILASDLASYTVVHLDALLIEIRAVEYKAEMLFDDIRDKVMQ